MPIAHVISSLRAPVGPCAAHAVVRAAQHAPPSAGLPPSAVRGQRHQRPPSRAQAFAQGRIGLASAKGLTGAHGISLRVLLSCSQAVTQGRVRAASSVEHCVWLGRQPRGAPPPPCPMHCLLSRHDGSCVCHVCVHGGGGSQEARLPRRAPRSACSLQHECLVPLGK